MTALNDGSMIGDGNLFEMLLASESKFDVSSL